MAGVAGFFEDHHERDDCKCTEAVESFGEGKNLPPDKIQIRARQWSKNKAGFVGNIFT